MATNVGGLILNNRLSAVPIFLASLEFPCLGFHAPAFAMPYRGSTNSRGKIGTLLVRNQSLNGPTLLHQTKVGRHEKVKGLGV